MSLAATAPCCNMSKATLHCCCMQAGGKHQPGRDDAHTEGGGLELPGGAVEFCRAVVRTSARLLRSSTHAHMLTSSIYKLYAPGSACLIDIPTALATEVQPVLLLWVWSLDCSTCCTGLLQHLEVPERHPSRFTSTKQLMSTCHNRQIVLKCLAS